MRLAHPDDRELMTTDIQRGLRGGGQFDLKLRIVRPDGEERAVYAVVVTEHDIEGVRCAAMAL